MKHYLDNSATTKVLPQAAQKALYIMTEDYGNPSSLHSMGFEAKRELETARGIIAARLRADPSEIIFTSGGTEANNLAVLGAAEALKRRGNRIVISAAEHESVLRPADVLEKDGFEVIKLSPDRDGHLSEEAIYGAVNEKTILVSLMLVNNETGAVFPVSAAKRALSLAKAPGVLHIDAVQAFGKIQINPRTLGADLITVSGHKIHAPKGVGALYIKNGVRLLPRALGGGQERNLRSGTESLPLIAAFGEAVRLMPKESETLKKVGELNLFLRDGLSKIPGVVLNSPPDALPYLLNFSAGRVRAETLLHFLSDREIYVSSGSACGRGKPSHVLLSMGLERERVSSAIRVSFSRFSEKSDVEALLSAVREGINTLAHE